jgi:hypothetical protein
MLERLVPKQWDRPTRVALLIAFLLGWLLLLGTATWLPGLLDGGPRARVGFFVLTASWFLFPVSLAAAFRSSSSTVAVKIIGTHGAVWLAAALWVYLHIPR